MQMGERHIRVGGSAVHVAVCILCSPSLLYCGPAVAFLVESTPTLLLRTGARGCAMAGCVPCSLFLSLIKALACRPWVLSTTSTSIVPSPPSSTFVLPSSTLLCSRAHDGISRFPLGCHMLACPLSLVVRGVDVDVDVDVCVCARLRWVTASLFLAWIGSSVLVTACSGWRSKGWFESVYLDHDLRVTRDVRGDVTVLVKSQDQE